MLMVHWRLQSIEDCFVMEPGTETKIQISKRKNIPELPSETVKFKYYSSLYISTNI